MLLTPLIRRQLAVFSVLAVVAVSMAAFSYAKVHQMAGIGVYDVTVDFADASGLYPKALVTYRGVQVGRVESLELGDDGAVARLRLDSNIDVPADAVAELHSTSAVGEQYVDLVPSDAQGPYLSQGDVIPRERAVEMPQITPVLDKLNALLESVPPRVTRRVLGQLDAGLGGTGPDLADLVDSSSDLIGEAQRQIGATTSLIATLQPVLGTQADLRRDTSSYTSSLADFTGELVRSDADIRALLSQGGPGLDAARGVVRDLTPTLPMLLDNLNATGEMLHTYRGSLAQTLAVYPATVARLQSTINPRAKHGDVQLDLRAMFGNPPSCVQGYLPVANRRVPGETSTRKVDDLAHCDVAPTHPSSIRGVRNLPCPDSAARGRLPASCGLEFEGGRSHRAGTAARQLASGAGPSQKGASTGATTKGADAWTVLVLGPLGLS